MGLDRTIHLKAFIKIPVQYEDYKEVVRTCGQHENRHGDNFCPICGKKIKEAEKQRKRMLWHDELIGNENFYHYVNGEVMYLFSNIYDCGINTEEDNFTILTPELIQEKIHYFESKHTEDIKLLKAKIHAKVEVEFGFVYEVR